MAKFLQIWVLYTLYLRCTSTETSSSLISTNFAAISRCLDSVCMEKVERVTRSKIECASVCVRDVKCAAFQFAHHGNCTLFPQECFGDSSRSSDNQNAFLYKRKKALVCQNGGSWDARTEKCHCVKGWAGSECERNFYMDCLEFRTSGYAHGTHWVRLTPHKNNSSPPRVKCELRGNEVFTYIFQNSGTSNHNKNWLDYINGYKNDNSNFWVGLDYMHAFNSRGNQNLIVMVTLKVARNAKNVLWRKYGRFQMRSILSGFKFTTSASKTGTLGAQTMATNITFGDVLGMGQGELFWTPDHDSPQDCAYQAQAGWWFPDCGNMITVNPMGQKHVIGNGQLRIPGLDMSDPDLQSAFETIAMAFVNNY